jgi:ubiquinone/menaquinone biosynthesis C-methylase UbiE
VPEKELKQALIDETHLDAAQRVLDMGCGTATLILMIEAAYPGIGITGLDGAPDVLAIARRKIEKARIAAKLDTALADHMPYPDEMFDRVVSSLMLHHLDSDTKRRAMREVYRVLKPGGVFGIADLGEPRNAWSRRIAPSLRKAEHAADNIDGLLPDMMRDAGFESVRVARNVFGVFVGTLTVYTGHKSD